MRYQKVFTQIWNDEKFTALSERGQRLFLYLLTNPHSNLIGIYVLKKGYAMDDLAWTSEGLIKALREVLRQGLISYDEKTSVLFLKNYLKHNPITNPNQLKAGVKHLNALPKSFILQELKEHVEGLPEGLTKGLLEGLGEAFLYTASASVTDKIKDLDSKSVDKGNGKIRYGDYVQMTPEQHERLVDEYGQGEVNKKILELNDYIGSHGAHNKYKRHDSTIRTWLRKDGVRPLPSNEPTEEDIETESLRVEAEELDKRWETLLPEEKTTYVERAKEELKGEFPPGFVISPLIRVRALELYEKDNT